MRFLSIPKIEIEVERVFLNYILTFKTATTRTLEAIPQNELEHAFESLFNRCNKCIEPRGEYFE